MKATRAIVDGAFVDEIVPVEVPQRKGPPTRFDTDEAPQAGYDPRQAGNDCARPSSRMAW